MVGGLKRLLNPTTTTLTTRKHAHHARKRISSPHFQLSSSTQVGSSTESEMLEILTPEHLGLVEWNAWRRVEAEGTLSPGEA